MAKQLYRYATDDEIAGLLRGPSQQQTQLYNALGRNAGMADNGDSDNFFVKRGKSIENALGTTLAAGAALGKEITTAVDRNIMRGNQKDRMDQIAKKYGYDSYHDVWDARDAAEAAGDSATLEKIDKVINPELQAQATENRNEADKFAEDYKDYAQNNYVSKKINQDPGKFAGSAINTLSTAADIALPAAGVAFNAVQGGVEGVADELEQNGLKDFDWGRAGQNALVGATTGAVVGGLNKGINNSLAKNGGKLFAGNNVVTRGLNKISNIPGPQRLLGKYGGQAGKAAENAINAVGNGAIRGAVSGAVGGATGAGLSAALNQQDVLSSALEGAKRGATQGALAGGVMSGANLALSKTPGVGKVMQNLNGASENWKNSGDDFNERLTNTINSGDSKFGDWLNRRTNSKLLASAGNIGNSVADVNTVKVDPWDRLAQQSGYNNYDEVIDRFMEANPNIEINQNGMAGQVLDWLDRNPNTPTTAGGWLKRAGERIVEDANNRGVGLSVKDVSEEMPTDIRNIKIQDNNRITTLDTLNPTGTVQTEYDPTFRANAPLGGKLTTYDKTANIAPDQEVTIYRGVPNNASDTMNPGDYVTTNRQLAQDYAGNGKVIAQKVPASSLVDDMSEPLGEEYIYRPQNAQVIEQPTMQMQKMTVNPQINAEWDNVAKQAGFKDYNDAVDQFKQFNPSKVANANNVLNWMDETQSAGNIAKQTANNPVPTSKQIKNKRLLVEEITKQFNPVDAPTSRSTSPNETFYNLYNKWGLSDGDDIRNAVSYAKQGALIPQMVREAAGEVGVVDLSDAQGMVMNLKLNKQASSKMINALENIIDSTDTTIIGGKKGVDALELQRTLEKMASDSRGTNRTYRIGNSVVDETMARNFERIARNIGDKLDSAAVAKGVVPEVLARHSGDLQDMKNALPGNKEWAKAIDTEIAGAKNIGDLRHSMRDLVRAGIFIENGDQKFGTFGGRMATNSDVPTTKAGVRNKAVNWVFDKINQSAPVRNAKLEKYAKALKAGDATDTPTSNNTGGLAVANEPINTPSTQIYNMVGRTEGNLQNEQARTADYLVNAAQEAEIVSDNNTQAPDTSTSLYDQFYGANGGATNATLANNTTTNNTGYFQSTGDYWADLLGRAMSSAIDADDVAAFAALYEMYQDQMSKLQKSSSSTQKLTTTQQRANAAANSLDRLENMTPDLAYNLSNIPIIGGIATIGGNDYEAEAKSLAQQIGYMVSGSNIKEEEAYNIGKAYVPLPWDNEQVRQNKLQRAREIISQYQNVTSED